MPDVSVLPEFRGSERSDFKRCQWKWLQSWRHGWTPKRPKVALLFGGLMHVALAAWYCGPGARRGPEPTETFSTLCSETQTRYLKVADATEEEEAEYTDMLTLGTAMLEGYRQRYGRDEHMDIICPEQTFEFNIPFPDWWEVSDRMRELLARYVGTYDLVYRDLIDLIVWLGEHKTAKSIRTEHLVLDEQGGSYVTVAERALRRQGLLKKDERVHGVMYNFLRKAMPDTRPRDAEGYCLNQNGTRSKVQPSPYFLRFPMYRTATQRAAQLRRLQTDAVQMEMARRGELPLTKTPHWSCARFCDLYGPCTLHESGGNYRDLLQIAYVREDPYADHRKSTDEQAGFEF